MYIFLDESGDLGFNFIEKTPSRNFVITLLVCNNRLIVKKINHAVKKTIQKINSKNNKSRFIHELKGSRTSFPLKQYFFNQMIKISGWQLYSVVLDKLALINMDHSVDINRVYNLLTHELLERIDFSNVKTVNLIVDKSKDSKNINDFDSYLKVNLGLVLPLKSTFTITHEVSQNNRNI